MWNNTNLLPISHDTTLTEGIEKDTASEMQHAVDTLVKCSELNHMKINTKKTKEMVIGFGPHGKESITAVVITSNIVECMSSYQLLGV